MLHTVLHSASPDPLVRTKPPAGTWVPDVEYNHLELSPRSLDMRLAFDAPSYGSEIFERIDELSESDGDCYFEFLSDANLGAYDDGLVGQLFGHPCYTDRDPFAYISEHTGTQGDEWIPFWRIDSDIQCVGSCIMDHGGYQVFVRRDALKKSRLM